MDLPKTGISNRNPRVMQEAKEMLCLYLVCVVRRLYHLPDKRSEVHLVRVFLDALPDCPFDNIRCSLLYPSSTNERM